MSNETKPLEQWMLEKGFTQRSLAREAQKLGFKLSDTAINLIVTGKRVNTRADTMRAIATALGIEIRQVREFNTIIETQLGKETRLTTLVSQQAGYNKTAAMDQIAAALP